MPSSYTADLYNGKQVTFQEFTMKCARAIDYLVDMHDKPFDATVPDEFYPNDYHLVELEKAKQYLTKIEKWSSLQAEKEANKAFDSELCSNNDYSEKYVEIGLAYVAMLKQAGRWTPPTKDHEYLKRFMIEHLAENLEQECLFVPKMPRRLSGEQYRKTLLKSVRSDIAYHTKEYAEEVQRVAKRNKWVRELRQSLKDFK